jgi:formate hydrogenlyase subunit 4
VTAFLGVLALLLHAALMAVATPALAGAMSALRSRLGGHAGAPLLQPFRDLRRLARKQPLLPESASPALAAAPLVGLAALALAALLVPSFTLDMTSAPAADLIVIAGLLATARIAVAVTGLDSGDAIGGLAAGRVMAAATLAEPALLLTIFAVATMAGSTNLNAVAGALREGGAGLRVSLGLGLAAAATVGVVEAGQLAGGGVLGPGQDTSRLALSGWHLAVAMYGGWLRLLVWLSLLTAMFAPAGIATASGGALAWLGGLLAWGAKVAGLAVMLVLFEAGRPALRLSHRPAVLGIALLLALLAVVFLFVGQGQA